MSTISRFTVLQFFKVIPRNDRKSMGSIVVMSQNSPEVADTISIAIRLPRLIVLGQPRHLTWIWCMSSLLKEVKEKRWKKHASSEICVFRLLICQNRTSFYKNSQGKHGRWVANVYHHYPASTHYYWQESGVDTDEEKCWFNKYRKPGVKDKRG